MKNTSIIILVLSVITMLYFNSCEKLDVPSYTPSCIKRKIRQIKSDKVRNPPASVWQYDYNGQTVYYFPAFCCDIPGELYDNNCNLICNPDGGITGIGDSKCSDFFSNRTNEKLIWQDDRN